MNNNFRKVCLTCGIVLSIHSNIACVANQECEPLNLPDLPAAEQANIGDLAGSYVVFDSISSLSSIIPEDSIK